MSAGAWAAIVRGPIIRDAGGRARTLVRPSAREFLLAIAVTVPAMIVLYSGLDGRNKALLATGATVFSPRLPVDDALGLFPWLVIAYYSYFPLLFFFTVLTIRDRRVMYEGVIGYLGCAAVGFLLFWLVPSRMVQPDLSSCATASCRMLDAMYRVDDGFNIFPSMHVGYSTLVWLFYRRYMPELARAVGAVVFAIILSTVLCKRHYLVDIPAGVVMASGIFALSQATGWRLAKALRVLGPAIVVL